MSDPAWHIRTQALVPEPRFCLLRAIYTCRCDYFQRSHVWLQFCLNHMHVQFLSTWWALDVALGVVWIQYMSFTCYWKVNYGWVRPISGCVVFCLWIGVDSFSSVNLHSTCDFLWCHAKSIPCVQTLDCACGVGSTPAWMWTWLVIRTFSCAWNRRKRAAIFSRVKPGSLSLLDWYIWIQEWMRFNCVKGVADCCFRLNFAWLRFCLKISVHRGVSMMEAALCGMDFCQKFSLLLACFFLLSAKADLVDLVFGLNVFGQVTNDNSTFSFFCSLALINGPKIHVWSFEISCALEITKVGWGPPPTIWCVFEHNDWSGDVFCSRRVQPESLSKWRTLWPERKFVYLRLRVRVPGPELRTADRSVHSLVAGWCLLRWANTSQKDFEELTLRWFHKQCRCIRVEGAGSSVLLHGGRRRRQCVSEAIRLKPRGLQHKLSGLFCHFALTKKVANVLPKLKPSFRNPL